MGADELLVEDAYLEESGGAWHLGREGWGGNCVVMCTDRQGQKSGSAHNRARFALSNDSSASCRSRSSVIWEDLIVLPVQIFRN